jgi:hypothetical protein
MINDDTKTLLSRRAFLGQSGIGLGALAATSLLNEASAGQSGNCELPHFPAKAKRVIYLFQSGGPSHIDLLDHSPAFERLHGSELPDSVRGGQRVTGMTAGQKKFLVCGPVSPMKQRGQFGTWMSDLVPHTADIADKITVINSMHTEAINHDPGITLINTGSQIPGARASARGRATAWGARMRTCPPTSCCSRRATARTLANRSSRGSGEAESYPRTIRGY